MTDHNQNPEQIARDNIDKMLIAASWNIQKKAKIDLNDGSGQAVREYQTDVGSADYGLFVETKAVAAKVKKTKTFKKKPITRKAG